MCFHNLHGICCRFSAVYNNGKVVLSCKLQLSHKPLFLQLMGFVIPIIVQTDFTHCNYSIIIQQGFHFCKCFFIQCTYFVRMDTNCGIDIRIFSRKFHTFLTRLQCRADIYNRCHSQIRHGRKQFFSVGVKLYVIIVCMCVKYHGIRSFPDSSFTDSITYILPVMIVLFNHPAKEKAILTLDCLFLITYLVILLCFQLLLPFFLHSQSWYNLSPGKMFYAAFLHLP